MSKDNVVSLPSPAGIEDLECRLIRPYTRFDYRSRRRRTLLMLPKKAEAILGERRGRMISAADRRHAIDLIDEAVAASAHRASPWGVVTPAPDAWEANIRESLIGGRRTSVLGRCAGQN